MNLEIVMLVQHINQVLGQRPIVDIGAVDHVGGCHRLSRIASLHGQGRPFRDLGVIFGILHAAIAVMGAHQGMAFLEECLIFAAHHKAHMGHGMDETIGSFDQALADQIRPELARKIKFNVHLQGFGDVHRTILGHRREIELTVAGMACARIVPGA